MAVREKCVSCGLLSFGGIFVVLGAILLTVIPAVIREKVRERGALGLNPNGTLNEMTTKWADPTYHIKMEVWMFSVLNPYQVTNYGAKPNVTQKGPYAFREVQHKGGIRFVDNQTKVFYRNYKTYVFERNESCTYCSLDDMITIPNIIYQKVINVAAGQSPLIRLALEAVLKVAHETPFVNVTVGGALFEGYVDNLISKICNHPGLEIICYKISKIPERIGFFYGQNGTDDGEYFIYSGKESIDNLGQIISWKGMTILPADWWSSNESRVIKGSDGGLFKPAISRSDVLNIFVSGICRSAYLRYKKDSEHEGIPTLRFGFSEELLDSSLPENKGYCDPNEHRYYSNKSQPDGCLPSGMLDIGRCQPGDPPIVISLPHYLYATEEIQNSIDGLGSPNLSQDETFVDIEPTVGVTINAVRRMMMNVAMWNADGNISTVANMKNVIVPVLLVNESAYMDNRTRDELKGKLINLQKGINAAGIILLVAGAFLWAVFIVLAIVWTVKKRDRLGYEHRPLTDHEELMNDSDAGTAVVPIRPS